VDNASAEPGVCIAGGASRVGQPSIRRGPVRLPDRPVRCHDHVGHKFTRVSTVTIIHTLTLRW
jgi:hypothetical protein